MTLRFAVLTLALAAAPAPLLADDIKLDIRGVRLGMSMEDVQRVADLPCHSRDALTLVCAQSDSSAKAKAVPRYFIAFVGDPATAASISYDFCAPAGFDAIQHDTIATFAVDPTAGRKIDRGAQFRITNGVDAKIVEMAESCAAPGLQEYELTIVDEDLIATESTATIPDQGAPNGPQPRVAPKF